MMKAVIAIFIFILSVLMIGQDLDKPFWGVHDWNGVRYGNIAKNYLRYGILETKFGPVENSGFANQNEFEYYTHYPPLLPLFIALSYKIFGISEWSTRLIPLLATSGSLVLIFLIGSLVWNIKTGLLASILGLVTPMVLYFGKITSHEPLTLFFILLSFYGYVSIGKLKYAKLIFIAGLVLAEMTVWAGYFLIPALTATHLLRKDINQLKKLIPYWILSIVLFSTHLLHINILTGSISGGGLFESFLQRTGLASAVQPSGFSLVSYLNQLRLWFSTLYTLTLTILATIWLIIERKGISKSDWPVFSLGLTGLIYISVFSSSVFIHNYLIFYFLSFMALAGSSMIMRIMEIKLFRKVHLAIPIIFILIIFFERKSFVDALNKSSGDKLAVEIGKAINQQTLPSDIILVSPIKYSYSSEKFLKFYSDRRLIFADDSQLDYDYRVVVDQDLSTFQISRK